MMSRYIAMSVALTLGLAGAAVADNMKSQPIVVPPDQPMAAPAPPALAPRSNTATITLDNWTVAFGIGGTWGDGTVRYNGKTYGIKVGGFDVLDIGIAKSSGSGQITNLNSIGDIEGTYSTVGPGFAFVGGAGGFNMENDRGVKIGMHNYEIGARAGVGAGAMTIQLK